jgi:hypothetical protein
MQLSQIVDTNWHFSTDDQIFSHNDLVSGVDGIFQRSTKVFNSQEVIWILFNNPKCGQLTKIGMHICMNMKYILHGHQ